MVLASQLMGIGQMARLTGLTAKALRHYDANGVLRPVDIDERTGYRRYAREQVGHARQIRGLRALNMPLEDIVVIVTDPGSAAATARLRAHRSRLRARLTQTQTSLYFLEKLIDSKDIDSMVMPARPTSVTLEPEDQKQLGIDLFNYVWTLLEKDDRTDRESERMIDAAHASRFFWEQVGAPNNHARGEWQLSRVYVTVGQPEPAFRHAERCLSICEEHGIGDFDLAYAFEALARACAAAGHAEAAAGYLKRAYRATEQVADNDDRELLLADLGDLAA